MPSARSSAAGQAASARSFVCPLSMFRQCLSASCFVIVRNFTKESELPDASSLE
jgi:hypothetical protein